MGEQHELMIPSSEGRTGRDTYAGKIHVEWDPQAAVTPLGQLPFFISFSKSADSTMTSSPRARYRIPAPMPLTGEMFWEPY